MIWPRVIGQQRVKATLLSALRTKRLAHAYMFYGGEGVGKDAMALELARVIHCERGGEEACGSCASCLQMNSLQHPDVHLVCALPVGKGENSDDSPTTKLTEQEIETIREEFKQKGQQEFIEASAQAKLLSKKRAEFIKKTLVERYKCDPERIVTEGKGWEQPIDATDHAANRRVLMPSSPAVRGHVRPPGRWPSSPSRRDLRW